MGLLKKRNNILTLSSSYIPQPLICICHVILKSHQEFTGYKKWCYDDVNLLCQTKYRCHSLTCLMWKGVKQTVKMISTVVSSWTALLLRSLKNIDREAAVIYHHLYASSAFSTRTFHCFMWLLGMFFYQKHVKDMTSHLKDFQLPIQTDDWQELRSLAFLYSLFISA